MRLRTTGRRSPLPRPGGGCFQLRLVAEEAPFCTRGGSWFHSWSGAYKQTGRQQRPTASALFCTRGGSWFHSWSGAYKQTGRQQRLTASALFCTRRGGDLGFTLCRGVTNNRSEVVNDERFARAPVCAPSRSSDSHRSCALIVVAVGACVVADAAPELVGERRGGAPLWTASSPLSTWRER